MLYFVVNLFLVTWENKKPMYVITSAIYQYVIFLLHLQGRWFYSEVTCLS